MIGCFKTLAGHAMCRYLINLFTSYFYRLASSSYDLRSPCRCLKGPTGLSRRCLSLISQKVAKTFQKENDVVNHVNAMFTASFS